MGSVFFAFKRRSALYSEGILMKARYRVVDVVLGLFLVLVWCHPAPAQMVWNHAAYFDGTGYVAIPHSPTLDITGSFTLEAWVNTTSSSVVSVVGDNEFRLLIDNGHGRIQFNNTTYLEGTKKINDGTWNHIACVFNNAGHYVAFYVNGVLDTSGSANTTPASGTDSLLIGRSIYGYGPATLDEIRIWNTALPDFDIVGNLHTSLAAGGGFYSGLVLSLTFQSLNHTDYLLDLTDKSGHGNNAVNRGAAAIDLSNAPSEYLEPNASLFLDGVGGYAVAANNPNLPALGPFTIEAWIYPLNPASGTQQTIVSREAAGYVGYEMVLTSTGRFALITMGTIGSSSQAIPANRWTHVAVTYTFDGTYATTQLFINGVRDGFYNASPISAVADSLCIGRSAGSTNYFYGYVDEVRMSNYVKTVDDLRKAMFTSIDYGNRRSSSNLELVYGLDGSLAPTTYAGPVLTLRGGSGTQFVSPAVGGGVPVTPLTRDPASPGSYPDGYYLRQAFKRVPASGTNAGYVEDTLNVAQSVTINDLKIFAGFNHLNESAVQLTLYAPTGDSLTFWNLDFQSAYTSGAATLFDDAADSAMDHRYISFIPTVRPHASINAAFGGKTSAGPWRLRMSQLINGFSGLLYGWGLEFNNETLVNVAEAAAPVPGKYVLSQAYPNPFNPSTTIRFEVPSASHVTLAVFNSIGQRVATLVDGDVPAGVHEVRFDGTRLSSGVYFYRMQSGAFIQTRKVVLVK
jgi:hypothetical protein